MTIKEMAEQYKYCNICGHEIKYVKSNFSECTNCGKQRYVSPVPCNGVIIENSNGEIMLVKRKTEPKKGWWDVPGGFIGPEESIEESTVREIEEELKVEIHNLKYFCSTSDEYTFENITFPTLGIVLTGSVEDQKLIPSDDIESYKFFKKEKIPFQRIAFKGVKQALEKFITEASR